jgi:hypothetical protein
MYKITSPFLIQTVILRARPVYYITAGKRGFLDVTVKGNDHRFNSLWENKEVKYGYGKNET